jgi:hypothetical protein
VSEAEGFADALSEHMRRTGSAVCAMLTASREASEGTDQA